MKVVLSRSKEYSIYPINSLIAECHDRFVHEGHWCTVSGMYGPSLRAVLADNELSPLQARQIKAIAWQVVRAVACE